ncbi:MAG: hypothetical protein ABGU93_12710 [Acetobacterium sp.]|uniref:hypothetical protein n=1 Tax=Acetobacterium sp. TaxID=1872094 RepID=UPI003242611B
MNFNKIIFNDKHWHTNDRNRGILIDSEAFPGSVKYVVKGNSLILLSGNHGVFCFDLKIGPIFLDEVSEIIDCYVQ